MEEKSERELFAEKYGLKKPIDKTDRTADFYWHKQSEQWLIKHNACERIHAIEKMSNPEVNVITDDINSAKMRALMKCFALGFGLGIQIFKNGETIPEGVEPEIKDKAVKKIADSKDKAKAIEKAIKSGEINDSTNEVELGQQLEKV